ncbi:tol-pal system YbgF family protein [Corallococcus exercitus]|uniref:tetratricopeptide repeat protein n=1 Tax=Corallococcus exercitus TaxID=2316736 RepID=UPI0035D3E77E
MSLTPVTDPSGLLERAPRLTELLPDAALSEALARGDAWAVHAVLSRRLEREPAGPTRELLTALVEDRGAFVIAGRPPPTTSVLGTGVRWKGVPPRGAALDAPFVAERTVTVLGVPVWPLDGYLVRSDGKASVQVIGQVPPSPGMARHRAGALAVMALGLCALAGAGAVWLDARSMRAVTVVNGLSRPVDVRIGGEHWVVAPGTQEQGRVKLGDDLLRAVATWPGQESVIEDVMLPTDGERILYNVRGVARLEAVPEPEDSDASPRSRSLPESAMVLQPGEQLSVQAANWEAAARAFAEAGRWQSAGRVASAVAEVEGGNTLARDMAARAFLLLDAQAPANLPDALRWRDTRDYAQMLMHTWQEDPAAQALALALMRFIGQGDTARARYAEHAQQHPDSPLAALYLQRASPPLPGTWEAIAAYQELAKRFPDSPEVNRAFLEARWRYELGESRVWGDSERQEFVTQTARLLTTLEEKHPPDTVEALELDVRIFLRAQLRDAATTVVRRYGEDPRRRTWDFLVLAGRTAAAAGPEHTSYVMRDWIPPALARQPERMALLDLLTGQRSPKEAELAAVASPVDRAVLRLTRDVLQDPKRAVVQAVGEPEAVLSRLDPEVAALLALELTRVGDARAKTLFNASLPLMLAREPLRNHLLAPLRKPGPELLALSPGLRAAVTLVHSRRDAREGYPVFAEPLKGLTRIDMLNGLAVRAAGPWVRSAFDACMDTKLEQPLPPGSILRGDLVKEQARQEDDREGRRPHCEARIVTPTGLPLPRAAATTAAGNANGADP